jgi:hypothetical protein
VEQTVTLSVVLRRAARQSSLLLETPQLTTEISEIGKAFAGTNIGITGSDPTAGMDASKPLFCVSVSYVSNSHLETGLIPNKGLALTVYIKNVIFWDVNAVWLL